MFNKIILLLLVVIMVIIISDINKSESFKVTSSHLNLLGKPIFYKFNPVYAASHTKYSLNVIIERENQINMIKLLNNIP